MRRTWFGVREPAVAEGFGAPLGAQVPMRVNADASRLSHQSTSAKRWWSPGLRVVRNALVAAVLMALVPMAIVLVRGDHLARQLYYVNGNTAARVAILQPMRAFAATPDLSITPMQAGFALNALQYRHVMSTGFVSITPAGRPVRPWRTNVITPDMFTSAKPDVWAGPSSQRILKASAKGFSPREMAYLRALADAPVWRDFDLVAHAPAVDVVGGQLRLPFDRDAMPSSRPLPSFRDSKEFAYAAVSRAAYLRSIGKPQEAEAVLHSIVSFGFAFVDNGTTTIEELIGSVIVGIGRDALQQFYALEHDPRADATALAVPARRASWLPAGSVDRTTPPDEIRRQLLARLANPDAPRPERFEAINALTMMSCTNVRELMFGPRDEVMDAIARARTTLARYPSEQALVDLGTRLPSATRVATAANPAQSLFVSPATVAGVVLHNPRMAACTLLLTSGR